MKVEQACRFRTSEGYGITAKTPGFDRNHEKALADAFNDSMIPVFANVGNSILSCSVDKAYTLYAKNTLRTHETRKVIFTHGYVVPTEDYARMMQEMPQRLLAVPASALMDIQTCGETMEQVDFPGTVYGELSLDEIAAKYHLDANRYSRLLMGAYETMTSNRSLRLYTSVPMEQREQLVRELTYCIVEGLLPVMKGRVSFSSGADTRMTISVLPAGEAVKHGDLVFGVEDDSYTNINFRDELSAACFQTLGSASREERKDLLEKMQNWLGEIVNIEESLTLLQICAAFIYQSGQKMTYDVAFGLFRGFQNAAGKSLSMKNANALLTELVSYMIDNDLVTTQAVSHFAQWYLMDSSAAFRRKTDMVLQNTSAELHVALVEAILQMPTNQNVRELINVLVRDLPVNSPELTDETRDQLALWIIREDADELAAFRDGVLRDYSDAKMTVLSQQLLSDAQDRRFNKAELEVIARTLYHMNAADTWFDQEDYARLDTHLEEFIPDQTDVIVANVLNIRVKLYSRIQERVDLLMRMSARYPAFHNSLNMLMRSGQLDAEKQTLWEHYQTRTIFTEDVTGDKVQEICRTYNSFMVAEGPFERKVRELWSRYMEDRMKAMMAGNGADHGEAADIRKKMANEFKQLNSLAASFLEEAARMRVSDQTREILCGRVAEAFWNLISYKHIACCDLRVSHELLEIDVPGQRRKCRILTECLQIMTRPDRTEMMIETVKSHRWSEKEWNEIQLLLTNLVCKLMAKKYHVSWDLLLLSCWLEDEEYDLDAFNDCLLKIEHWRKKQKITVRSWSADDSVMLRDNALRKQVRRSISDETEMGERLAAELKRGGRPAAHREEKPARNPAPPAKQAERNPRKESKPAPSQTQPKGNRLVSFGEQTEPQKPEKKGLFSDLFKRGK